MGEDIWKLIDERRDTKTKIDSTQLERIKDRIRNEYRTKDREVKKSVRED